MLQAARGAAGGARAQVFYCAGLRRRGHPVRPSSRIGDFEYARRLLRGHFFLAALRFISVVPRAVMPILQTPHPGDLGATVCQQVVVLF